MYLVRLAAGGWGKFVATKQYGEAIKKWVSRTEPLSPKKADERLHAIGWANSLPRVVSAESDPTHRSEHFVHSREKEFWSLPSLADKISHIFSEESAVKKRHLVIDPMDMPTIALLPKGVYYQFYLKETIHAAEYVASLAMGNTVDETEKRLGRGGEGSSVHVHDCIPDIQYDTHKDVDYVICASNIPMMPSLDLYLSNTIKSKASTCFAGLPTSGSTATGLAYLKLFRHLSQNPTHSALAVSSDLASFYYANSLPASLQKIYRNPLLSPEQREAVFLQDVQFPSLSGDGASASYFVGPSHPIVEKALSSGCFLPYCVAINEAIIPHSNDFIGYTQEEEGFRIVLNHEMERHIPALADKLINGLLRQNGLQKSDISEYLFHVGGQSMLKGYRDTLGLPEHSVFWAQSSIAEFGNMSASSSVDSLRRWMNFMEYRGKLQKGARFILFTAGPGVRGIASLWEIR